MIRELKCKTSPQSLAEDYSFPARPGTKNIFPQQHKLTVSSAQNSCGVHWCRHRVRFNEVPEKVPKVPEKVWDLVQRQVRFNRVPEIQRRFQEARVQSQVRFNRFKGFPVLGFAARVRKICKNKRLRLLGIPPKLIVSKCDH